MASRRLLLLLLAGFLAALPAPARAGPTGSLAWLPDEILDDTHLHAYSNVVAELRAAIPAGVVYHRHQGRHRLSDRPMGGVLVAPVDERRVPIVDGMRAHFDAAVILPFPPDHRLRSSILPPDIQLAIRRAYLHGPRLPFFRRERARLVRRLSDQLRPVSARIASLMQPSVLRCAGSINVAFIAAFIDASNWLDVDLPRRLVEGFITVGECCDSGVYRRIEPLVSREKWQARLARFVSSTAPWNRALLRRLARRASAAGADRLADVALAAKTAKELIKGAVIGPYRTVGALSRAIRHLHPAMPAEVVPRLMERFGIAQKDAIRAIDNGKSNSANWATRMYETVSTPDFAYVAVVARAFVDAASSPRAGSPPLAPSCPKMAISLRDLTMAYRTIPTAQPWYGAFAFFNPVADPPGPELYFTPGHNFGLTSAVVNFNRYPEFAVVALRALFDVPAEHFYDDFIVPDLAVGGDTAFLAVGEILNASGCRRRPDALIRAPEIDPGKDQHPGPSNTVLGVITDLSRAHTHGQVLFRADPERAARYLRGFREAFRRGVLTPSEAGKLRGQFFFLLSAAYASIGRAATLSLVQRQYRDKTYEFLPGSALHHTLLFFEALLSPDLVSGTPALPPLVVPVVPDPRPPLLVYSDAAFALRRLRKRISGSACHELAQRLGGGLGVVIYDPLDGMVRWAAAKPDWQTLLKFWPGDRKTYIAQLEVLAAVAVYYTYPRLFVDRRVNHWIDNTVALSALVHGYSGKLDLATMVNAFYLQIAGLRSAVYFDWVPSKANIADLPSRDAWEELAASLSGIPLDPSDTHILSVPNLADWNAPLAQWATRHARLLPPQPSAAL